MNERLKSDPNKLGSGLAWFKCKFCLAIVNLKTHDYCKAIHNDIQVIPHPITNLVYFTSC